MTTWVVGLGANLGDREEALASAIERLSAYVHVRAVSSVYETKAIGPPQPHFLNAAVRVETDLAPEALLDVLLSVERSLGRIRAERWGPRTIDLDLLFGEPVATERLVVPHPHLCERTFALAPLLEVYDMPSLRASLAALGGAPPKRDFPRALRLVTPSG